MRIFKSAVIDAPVEKVWTVLRCFDGVVKWNSGVVEARIENGEPNDRVGCIRRLVLPDGKVHPCEIVELPFVDPGKEIARGIDKTIP